MNIHSILVGMYLFHVSVSVSVSVREGMHMHVQNDMWCHRRALPHAS